MLYYRHVKHSGGESQKFFLLNCGLNVLNSGWLVYGNFLFWPNYRTCTDETQGDDSTFWVIGILIVLGFVTLLKCCAVSTVMVCFAPLIIRTYRTEYGLAQPSSHGILKKLAAYKFNSRNTECTECIICMEDYRTSDSITPMPCNSKHVFHSKCIKKWLKKNNSCPLCKTSVTMASIRRQQLAA